MAEEVFYSKPAPVFSIHQDDTRDLFDAFHKLYKTKSFSDFTIKCQSQEFRVHRAIVVSQLTYFSNLLLDNDSNVRSPPVLDTTLDTIDPNTLGLILDFVYSGCLINVPDERAKTLREAADQLGINQISKKCKKVELSKTEATPGNCIEGWKTAMEVEDDDLCENFSKVALTHFPEVTTSPSFVKHDLMIIRAYLGHEDLKVNSPNLILPVALNWVRANLTKRLPHLPALLKSIPLHAMDINVLQYLLQGEPMFTQHTESRTILQDAITQSGVSPSVPVAIETPASSSTIISFPCVAVTWSYNKAIKVYDESLREEVKTINVPPEIINVQRAGCCKLGDYLFVCGEKELFSCYLDSSEWRARGELKYPRSYPALTTIGKNIYIFGGRKSQYNSMSVGTVEVWDHANRRLAKAGKLNGDKCYYTSCCVINEEEIAVWGMEDTAAVILQVYSTTTDTVTFSARVKGASSARGVVYASDHIIMCDDHSAYVCPIREVYKKSRNCATKLNNFKPPIPGSYSTLILSDDRKKVTAICSAQHVVTADVQDVIIDNTSGWTRVETKWTPNSNEWCAPGAVCML